MPKNMPEIEIDRTIGTAQALVHVKHARRYDGVRGVQIGVGTERQTSTTFMDYTEAVKLHEALGTALAFLDAEAD